MPWVCGWQRSPCRGKAEQVALSAANRLRGIFFGTRMAVNVAI